MCNAFMLLKDSAQRYPENVYIIDKEIHWTYSNIYKRVIALSKYISICGVNKGDRVLIYLDNSVEYVLVFFSILLANGIAVPINKNTTIENIKYIVKDTSPKIIISNDVFFRRIGDKVDFKECKTINLDLISKEALVYIDDLICELTSDINLPTLILYTSGTTKMPKGVTLTHKNLLANTEAIIQYLKLTSEDSILATINFSYSYGNSLLLTHTKVGGTIIIENRTSYPIKIVEQVCLNKVSGFSTVGSYLNILLKQNILQESHLVNLKYITFAGESTNFDDILMLYGMAPHLLIFVMYGQTEATARLSYLEPSMLFKKPGSIGKGIPGVSIRVVTEDGRDVYPGDIGEIIVSGDNVMKGYWNNEIETKSVVRNGWLYTGDTATVDDDGYIYVKGRKDDIIKYLGHRISPMEIESVINLHKHVLESAVIEVNIGDEKQIKAYIVPKENVFETEELDAHIRKLLPYFKRPHIIDFICELPRTSNGKIKRSELRKV